MNKALVYIPLIMLIILSVAGCASMGTFNPATGKKEFIFISSESEVSMGRNVNAELIRKYRLSDDKAKNERLKEIGARVSSVSDRKDYAYNFYLLQKDEINAFTTPGGNLYVFSGLFDKLKSDDEIAAVLSDEIGHCAARHVVKRIQAELGYNILGSLIFTSLKTPDAQKKQIAYAANSITNLVMLGYSREDEYMADKLGVKYMHMAGYDPEAILKTLQMLKENSKGAQGPLILRSHPYLDDRIIRVQYEIANLKKGV